MFLESVDVVSKARNSSSHGPGAAGKGAIQSDAL